MQELEDKLAEIESTLEEIGTVISTLEDSQAELESLHSNIQAALDAISEINGASASVYVDSISFDVEVNL